MSRNAHHIDLSLLDLSLLDSNDASQSARATQKAARFAGAIVSFASLVSPGRAYASGVPCRKRPQRRPCPGRLEIAREEDTDDIHWICPQCRDTGLITGWRHSRWDLTPDIQSGQVISLIQRQAESETRSFRGTRPQIYELEVELVAGPIAIGNNVWRRLVITSDKTLHDLHELLREAFNWQEDQPYDFMFGAPYERDSRRFTGGIEPDDIALPEMGLLSETHSVSLASLELKPQQSFGYLFDFGEEWVHRITLKHIHDVVGPCPQPQITGRKGVVPPQHPDSDDEWDDDALWTKANGEFPLTSVYGPYVAEENPPCEAWNALDEFERILLVCEAHVKTLPEWHPPIENAYVHALLHCVAEARLLDRDSTEPSKSRGPMRQADTSRHYAVHSLGAEILRDMLDRFPLQRKQPVPCKNTHRSKTPQLHKSPATSPKTPPKHKGPER